MTTTSEPLVVEFHVAAPPSHAFEVWTSRIATWWPPSHTISGDPASITVEPHVGGRVVETAPDGTEHTWGEVLVWEPPEHLRLLWHLFFDHEEATEVDIRFVATAGRTRVHIEQTGWERLGAAGAPRRERTGGAWSSIAAHFVAGCEAGWNCHG